MSVQPPTKDIPKALNDALSPNTIYIALNSLPTPNQFLWSLVLTDDAPEPTPAFHETRNHGDHWVHEQRSGNPLHSATLVVLVKLKEMPDPAAAMKQLLSVDPEDSEAWVMEVLKNLQYHRVVEFDLGFVKMKNMAYQYGLKHAGRASWGLGALIVNNPKLNVGEEEDKTVWP